MTARVSLCAVALRTRLRKVKGCVVLLVLLDEEFPLPTLRFSVADSMVFATGLMSAWGMIKLNERWSFYKRFEGRLKQNHILEQGPHYSTLKQHDLLCIICNQHTSNLGGLPL
jgi:hypothetical protein